MTRPSVEELRKRSTELEEACDFVGAARYAAASGDARRTAHLAALGGDEALCFRAISVLAEGPREQAQAAAVDLGARGFHRYAGALFEKVGAHIDAAAAYSAGGDAVAAALCFEAAGRPADGARTLEAAIRRAPERDDQRLALGRLLARHGKLEGAVRALQQVFASAPERPLALPDLFRCLEALNLHEAAREVREEMRGLGLDPDAPSEPAAAATRAPPAGGERAPTEVRATLTDGEAPGSLRKSAVPSVPAPAAPPTRVLFGRYDVVREVAATPHARLIEAKDRLTGELVAVKVFASAADGAGRDAWQRFEREARSLMLLCHPNVVPLRAYHPESGAMVLAWMAGGSLADKLERELFAPARAVEIASAVLGALGEAHRLGILHRDVKPSNILFDEAGSPYLSDFGAAHLGDLSSTATAGAIGTFAYMSPEQRLGRPATLASDLYGVGAVLLEMLTGAPPSAATSDEPKSASAPLDLADFHPELTGVHEAVVRRLLNVDPDKRPADAFAARRELGAVPWPLRLPPQPEARPRVPSVRPTAKATLRLEPLFKVPPGSPGADGAMAARDAWLERAVLLVPMSEAELARARAFARAAHPALPLVLRVDPVEGHIWVSPALGEPLRSRAMGLTRGQRRRLRDAVEALHAAGGAHGKLDVDHIYVVAGDVALAYPLGEANEEALVADRNALQALEKS